MRPENNRNELSTLAGLLMLMIVDCVNSNLLAALREGVDIGEERAEAGCDKRSFVLGPVQTALPGER